MQLKSINNQKESVTSPETYSLWKKYKKGITGASGQSGRPTASWERGQYTHIKEYFWAPSPLFTTFLTL